MMTSVPAPAYSSNGYSNGPQDSGGGGQMPVQAQQSYDDWDEEWDDDDESSNSTVGTSGGQVRICLTGVGNRM